MNIDREMFLSDLEAHISRTAQVIRKTATADHVTLCENTDIWLEFMEADLRLQRGLFESLGLTEKPVDEK